MLDPNLKVGDQSPPVLMVVAPMCTLSTCHCSLWYDFGITYIRTHTFITRTIAEHTGMNLKHGLSLAGKRIVKCEC